MAALGSLWVYWTEGEDFVTYGEKKDVTKATSFHSGQSDVLSHSPGTSVDGPRSPPQVTNNSEMIHYASNKRNSLQPAVTITGAGDEQEPVEHIEDVSNGAVHPTPGEESVAKSKAGRFRVRKLLNNASVYMSETAHRELDTKEHKNKKAYKYPMVPSEDKRNEDFYRTSEQFKQLRMQRVASSASSTRSSNGEGPSTPPAAATRSRADTSPDAFVPPLQRDMLEVPEVAYHSPKLGSHQGWA